MLQPSTSLGARRAGVKPSAAGADDGGAGGWWLRGGRPRQDCLRPGVGNKRQMRTVTDMVNQLRERLPGLVFLPAHDPGAGPRLTAALETVSHAGGTCAAGTGGSRRS